MQVVSKINEDPGAAGAKRRTDDLTSGAGITWIPPWQLVTQKLKTHVYIHWVRRQALLLLVSSECRLWSLGSFDFNFPPLFI